MVLWMDVGSSEIPLLSLFPSLTKFGAEGLALLHAVWGEHHALARPDHLEDAVPEEPPRPRVHAAGGLVLNIKWSLRGNLESVTNQENNWRISNKGYCSWQFSLVATRISSRTSANRKCQNIFTATHFDAASPVRIRSQTQFFEAPVCCSVHRTLVQASESGVKPANSKYCGLDILSCCKFSVTWDALCLSREGPEHQTVDSSPDFGDTGNLSFVNILVVKIWLLEVQFSYLVHFRQNTESINERLPCSYIRVS